MACVNSIMSWTFAILHLFSQETDLLMKVIMTCVNVKLWDIQGCFHYILNAPRIPNYFNNFETPIICYKYNKPIRSTIFNFNKIVNDLDIDSNTAAS